MMSSEQILGSAEITEKEESSSYDQEDYTENTEMEQTKVLLMRAFVERQDPSSKKKRKDFLSVGLSLGCGSYYAKLLGYTSQEEVDDLLIRRFLRARDLDIEKASSMFLRYLKWRRAFVPNNSISPSEIQNEIAQNKMFLQGSDKKGRPISVVLGARHVQSKGGLDEFKRFIVYAFDKMCSRLPSGQEKFVIIGDLEGWGYTNSDIRGYLGALSILQDYYPERLGKLYIVHAPYIFMTLWKIVYPFIDKRTRKKIVFVENKKLKSTLLEDIDENQIPEIYGGQLPLVPIHES